MSRTNDGIIAWTVASDNDAIESPKGEILLRLVFTHVEPGSFIDRSGRSNEIDFIQLTWQLRFWSSSIE